MTITSLLGLGVVEASFVGGPAHGTTCIIRVEPNGFPPIHVSIPDDDGITCHLYSGLSRDRTSLTVFHYLGPLPS